MTSARRQAAMTGTWSSSAKRVSSVDVRARRTPPPARMTGRRAEARNSMTERISSSVARGVGGPGAVEPRVVRHRLVEEVLRRATAGPGPGRPPSAWRMASADGRRRRRPRSRGSAAHLARPPSVATWSISWNASRPRSARSTWPTSANIGVESWRAVWMPMARFAAADGARPEADRRAAGQLAVRLGHERGGALVARRDDADPGGLEGVEQAEERLAGHGEGVADAGRAERVGDEPADGPRSGRRRPARLRARSAASGSTSVVGSARRARRSARGGSARLGASGSWPSARDGPGAAASAVSRSGSAARLRSIGGLAGLGSRLGQGRVGARLRARSAGSSASVGGSSVGGAASSSVMATALLRSMWPVAGDGQR